jgi:hypothetical protein
MPIVSDLQPYPNNQSNLLLFKDKIIVTLEMIGRTTSKYFHFM